MSVNVSQKDATLREIIRIIETTQENTRQAIAKTPANCNTTITHLTGELCALARIRNQCQDMLGYSGNMPDNVPNQSK